MTTTKAEYMERELLRIKGELETLEKYPKLQDRVKELKADIDDLQKKILAAKALWYNWS